MKNRRLKVFIARMVMVGLLVQHAVPLMAAYEQDSVSEQPAENLPIKNKRVKSEDSIDPHALIPTADTSEQIVVIDDEQLEHFIASIVKTVARNGTQETLSEEMMIFCEQLLTGKKEFSVGFLCKVVPQLLTLANKSMEEERAMRPNVGFQDGSIVGPLLSCNFDQVLALLHQIFNFLMQCCATIEFDLNGVFTLLNTDFNGTFTFLNEIENTLTTCCATIENDLNGVFTLLNTDFNGTFTFLNEIENTITTCCAIVENDLNGVFTLLNTDFNGTFTFLDEIENTLTTCCAIVENDLNGVFTALAALTVTVTVDFTDVFTTLDDINNTLTTCCAIVENDLNGVFTVLNTDFNGVFTALADLSVTVTVDFTDVFTTLDEINNTLTTCCAIVENDLNGVFTALNDISTSFTVDITNIFTTLEDINNTLTTCCAIVENDLNGVFTVLNTDFNGTFTMLTDIFNTLTTGCASITPCNPVFITQADVGTTGYTITQSGVYFLKENIVFSPATISDAITIEADDVQLNLQCFILSQGNAQPSVTGIVVVPGVNSTTIENGTISGFTNNGISVDLSVSDFTLLNTVIRRNGSGLFLDGVVGSPVSNFIVRNVEFNSNLIGLVMTNANNGIIQGSILSRNKTGIMMTDCSGNVISQCDINQTVQTDQESAYGIIAQGGSNNRFERCIIDGTSTMATTSAFEATGLYIGSDEQGDLIVWNQISNSTTSSNAFAYGIHMDYTFIGTSTEGMPSIVSTNTIMKLAWSPSDKYLGVNFGFSEKIYEFDLANDQFVQVASVTTPSATSGLSWSPDGSFIAFSDQSGAINIYSFAGTTLNFVTSFDVSPNIPQAVAWSPDGRFIAVGTSAGSSGEEIILEFNGSSLSQVASFSSTFAPLSIAWAPEGDFLAVGTTENVIVLKFVSGITLTQVAIATPFAPVPAVDWAVDGRSIVTAQNTGTQKVVVYSFSGTSLTIQATVNNSIIINDVKWSPDGNYVVMVSDTGGVNDTHIFKYTGVSLVDVADINHGANINSASWSHGGAYIAIGGQPPSNEAEQTLNPFLFPVNIIRNNEIYNIHGPALAAGIPGYSTGRALSASSNTSLIIQNTAFNNDVNYVFVTNTYQQFLANTQSMFPNLLSNMFFPPL